MQLSSAQMFHHRWCAALAAGDVAAVRAMFHPDAVQVSAATGRVLTGAEQIVGALEQVFTVAGPVSTSRVESFVDLGDSFVVESVQSTSFAQLFSYEVFVLDGGLIRLHTSGSIAPRSLAPLPAPSGPTQGQDIYRRYWTAAGSHDAAMLAGLCTPDIRFAEAGVVVYGRDAIVAGAQQLWANGMRSTLKTVSRFVEAPEAFCVESTSNVGNQNGAFDLTYYEVWVLRQGLVSHIIKGLITPRPEELRQMVQRVADANQRAVQDFAQASMMRNAMQVRW